MMAQKRASDATETVADAEDQIVENHDKSVAAGTATGQVQMLDGRPRAIPGRLEELAELAGTSLATASDKLEIRVYSPKARIVGLFQQLEEATIDGPTSRDQTLMGQVRLGIASQGKSGVKNFEFSRVGRHEPHRSRAECCIGRSRVHGRFSDPVGGCAGKHAQRLATRTAAEKNSPIRLLLDGRAHVAPHRLLETLARLFQRLAGDFHLNAKRVIRLHGAIHGRVSHRPRHVANLISRPTGLCAARGHRIFNLAHANVDHPASHLRSAGIGKEPFNRRRGANRVRHTAREPHSETERRLCLIPIPGCQQYFPFRLGRNLAHEVPQGEASR